MKRLTPLKAIRKYCYWCVYGSAEEIRECPSKTCPLWKFRMGKKVKGASTLKAIRKKCLDCAGTANNVRNCPHENCPRYLYRCGHNPSRQGIGRKGGVPPKNRS